MLAIVWILVVVAAGYFLLWRPQQRRMANVRAMQQQLREGDEVMTTAGIYGRVVELHEDRLRLEIAPGTIVLLARGAVGEVLTRHDDADGTDEAGTDPT